MILSVLKWIAGLFGGGFLDRILKTVDSANVEETARQGIRADAVKTYIQAETQWRMMATASRAFWVCWFTAAFPLMVWLALVFIDSWSKAYSLDVPDLPATVKPYANQIFVGVFGSGVGGLIAQIGGAVFMGRR